MAAMVTKTDKLGFLGGLDIYLINKFRYGYEQGAKYINSDINVKAVYSPDPTNPWGDIAGGKTVGQTLYAEGRDVVYAAAGGTGIGVMQAANETDDVYAIGVDSDQDYIVEGKVLCSMLKLVETAVFTSIEAKMEDTWRDGLSDEEFEHIELGIKEGGVGISEMKYTKEIKNGYYEYKGENKTRWEHIEDIIEKIEKGYLKVSDSSGEFEESIPTPGFEIYVIFILLGLAVIQIRRKRR
jgi:basic membrane protein A